MIGILFVAFDLERVPTGIEFLKGIFSQGFLAINSSLLRFESFLVRACLTKDLDLYLYKNGSVC
jgi:hypothetical protein